MPKLKIIRKKTEKPTINSDLCLPVSCARASLMEEGCEYFYEGKLQFSGINFGSCLAQMTAVKFIQDKWWPTTQVFFVGFATPRCGSEVGNTRTFLR